MSRFMIFSRILISAFLLSGVVQAEKLDAARHEIKVKDIKYQSGRDKGKRLPLLADGIGAESFPIASECWTPQKKPLAGEPAALVFDYQEPVRVAALAHYFYVPGCRDHRFGDWCSGPSAFQEVKMYVSDDEHNWREVSHLTDLPAGCPQLLLIEHPESARYLKQEVYIHDESILQFWALWDCAQKVTFTIPWLIDEVKRRSGNTIQINVLNLTGTDDRDAQVVLGNFDGPIESDSGQVNWIYLKSHDGSNHNERQLVLINHGEPTSATVELPSGTMVSSLRGFDSRGHKMENVSFKTEKDQIITNLPENSMVIILLKAP